MPVKELFQNTRAALGFMIEGLPGPIDTFQERVADIGFRLACFLWLATTYFPPGVAVLGWSRFLDQVFGSRSLSDSLWHFATAGGIIIGTRALARFSEKTLSELGKAKPTDPEQKKIYQRELRQRRGAVVVAETVSLGVMCGGLSLALDRLVPPPTRFSIAIGASLAHRLIPGRIENAAKRITRLLS